MTLPIVVPLEKLKHENAGRLAYIVNPNLIAWIEPHGSGSGSIIHMSGAPAINTPLEAAQLDKLFERYKSVQRGM